MASWMYNQAKIGFANGTEDWDTNTYKVMLVDNTYPPTSEDASKDETNLTTLASSELSGTGYTGGFGGGGRKTLATLTVVQDDTNNRAELQCSTNTTWTGIDAGTIDAAVIIRESGSDAASFPIAYLDSASIAALPLTTNGGDVTIQWNVDGIIQITDAAG